MSNKRILSLDGYRAIAALGVVWIHTWESLGSPRFGIFHVDWYRMIAIVGNGVDLFFVISGFCMYLVYSKQALDAASYLNFVKKRWKRIAPAYYSAVIVYGLLKVAAYPDFPIFPAVAAHFLFFHTYISHFEISAPFWSIATEWHFYLIVPFFFLSVKKIGVNKSFLLFSLISIVFGMFFYHTDPYAWSKSIGVRLIEFMWGAMIGYWYLNPSKSVFQKLSPALKIFAGFLIAYAGRATMVTEVLKIFGSHAWIIRSFSVPVMTLGFAIMIYNTIVNPGVRIAKILGSRIFSFLGRISYSIYLWHSLVLSLLSIYLAPLLGRGALSVLITFLCVCCLTIPLSYISYKLFEEFYFRSKSKMIFSAEK